MSKQASSLTNWHDYVESRLSAFIDGQLPEDERIQVRKHLGECPRCQASLDSLGWTIKLVKQLPVPPLPRQFTLPVPEARPAPASAGWLRWGLAAASALAVLVLAVFISLQLLKPESTPFSGTTAMQAAPTAVAAAQPKAGNAAPQTSAAGAVDRTAPIAATVAPTSAPAATSAPAVPPVAPVAAQPTQSKESAPSVQSLPSPTVNSPRATRNSPTPTMICEFGCGAGPSGAPPGMGGGAGASLAPTMAPSASGPMASSSLAPLDSLIVITGTVTTQVLNVRATPSESADRIGVLRKNAPVDIAGRDDTARWIEIIFHETNQPDRPGWVISSSISLSVSIYDLPIIMTPPTWTPTPTPAGMSVRPPRATRTATRIPSIPSPTGNPVVNFRSTATPTAPTADPSAAAPDSSPTISTLVPGSAR